MNIEFTCVSLMSNKLTLTVTVALSLTGEPHRGYTVRLRPSGTTGRALTRRTRSPRSQRNTSSMYTNTRAGLFLRRDLGAVLLIRMRERFVEQCATRSRGAGPACLLNREMRTDASDEGIACRIACV